MATPYGEQVLAQVAKPRVDEPTIEGIPMDEYLTAEQAAQTQGGTLLTNDDGTPYEPQRPDKGELYSKESEDKKSSLYGSTKNKVEKIIANLSWNEAHIESITSGNPEGVLENADVVAQGGTITSYATDYLLNQYTDELVDYGVLDGLSQKPPEEQLRLLEYEASKLNMAKQDTKFLLAMNALRAGFGSQPRRVLDTAYRGLAPPTLQAMRRQQIQSQWDDLQREVDATAAQYGEGLTAGKLVIDMTQQDLIPFYGAFIRVLSTNKFIPRQLDISNIRSVLPGEVRQEIREWLNNPETTQEERLEYVKGIRAEWEKLKKSPTGALFTTYGQLENMMEIFTDDLMSDKGPDDGFIRFLGNLDVLLGGVLAAGTMAKRGTSFLGLYKARNASAVRNAARAANNHEAVNEVNRVIAQIADELGVPKGQLVMDELPRPGGLSAVIEASPDDVKAIVSRGELARDRVLNNLDDLTGKGLTEADKASATATFIKKMSDADGVHANHRMLEVEELPNGTGVRVTATYGQAPNHGWSDFAELVDDLVDLDPTLSTFKIAKRGPDGNLVDVDVTTTELLRFWTKGEVPAIVEQGLDEFSASSRLFQGRRLSGVPDAELLDVARTLDPASHDFANIMRTIDLRKKGGEPADILTPLDGAEYYVRRTEDRYWAVTDKDNLSTSYAHTWTGDIADEVLPPNSRFSDDIIGAFYNNYLHGQQALAEFSEIYKPFYNLRRKSKVKVNRVFEWAEDYAKDAWESTGIARAPTRHEILDAFPDLTNKEFAGWVSIRQGQDLQYELFNQRLYREKVTAGEKTIRAVDGSAPNYHGKVVDHVEPGTYLDPYTGKGVKMSAEDVEDIYANGGTFLELEMAIDAPVGGGSFTKILVKQGDYQVGTLSPRVLNYFEGYSMRFYDDPIYIIKHDLAPTINGAKSTTASTEAIRTAGSTGEARRFLARMGRRSGRNQIKDRQGRVYDPEDPNIRYEVRRAQNISNVEGTLFQQQALHKEGRLFWDERQHERLPDVNGNKAKIADIQQTLEKGTAMALRQTTQEDLMRTMLHAFGREFDDIPELGRKLHTDDLSEVITDLTKMRSNASSPEYKARLSRAISIAKYMRTQVGTDSFMIPALRQRLTEMAEHVSTIGGGKYKAANILGGWLEKRAVQADPFRFARSIAWNTFMVFRPGRQLALQSLQVSYLSAIDPAYIATGRVLRDGLALKRGLAQARRTGFDDGWSDAAAAKFMGLSKKEYKRLVEEFDRSGLFDSVNVHAFNPAAGMAGKASLSGSLPGRFMYHVRTQGRRVHGLFQKGFDIGESNNLAFTYMIAMRKALREKNLKSLTQLSRAEFDELAVDAANMALAMIKPNKFAYQSGASGSMMQFLSFSHKALLGFAGQNPALKGKGLRLAMTTYALFGANIFGAEDYMRETLSKMGLTGSATREVVPGITLQDVLSAGLVESIFNALGDASAEEWQDIDIGSFAPGANLWMIYEEFLSGVVEGNIGIESLAGPSSTPIAAIMKSWRFATDHAKNDTRSPTEKLADVGVMAAREIFPQVNDANRAWYAYQMGVWMDKSGDKLPIQSSLNSVIARGLLGIRPKSEMAYYQMKTLHWEEQSNVEDIIKGNKEYLNGLLNGWSSTAYSDEFIHQMVRGLMSLYEDAPEGVRMEIYKRSLLDGTPDNPSIIQMLAEKSASGTYNMDSMIPWIEKQSDWSIEQKRQLVEHIRETQQGRKNADAHFKQILEDGRTQ